LLSENNNLLSNLEKEIFEEVQKMIKKACK